MKLFKKFAAITATVALCLSATPAFAAYEAAVKFGTVAEYDGKVYTQNYWGTNGGVRFQPGNVAVYSLPSSTQTYETCYQFTIYNNKIYYMTFYGSGGEVPVQICSSDLDGSNIQVLADNAAPFGNVYIVDNVLYYEAFTTNSEYDAQGYYGGIYKINLADLSWAKIVNKSNVELTYTDGDYVYYKYNNYIYPSLSYGFATSTDGSRTITASLYSDEFNNNTETYNAEYFVRGNKTYYSKDNSLFVKDKNGWGDRKICYMGENAYIESITFDSVYYVTVDYSDSYNLKAHVYRANIGGAGGTKSVPGASASGTTGVGLSD